MSPRPSTPAMGLTTLASKIKAAMVTAARDAINDQAVWVGLNTPGFELPDDIVGVQKITSRQEAATMGTNRSREETLTVDVMISCFRGGGDEAEQLAYDRAYELLGRIERHVHYVDTTLGGIVRDCFLTEHEAESATDPKAIAKGRTTEILATFTAHGRVSRAGS